MKRPSSHQQSVRLLLSLLFLVLAFSLPALAAVPGKVKIKDVATTASTVKLSWGKVSGAKGYNLYAYDLEGEPFLVTKLGSSKTSYTVKKLSTGTTYTYFLKAFNADGEGAASEEVEATPAAKGLEQIQNVVVTNGTNYVELRYYRNMDATGYVIYRRNSSGNYKKIATTKNVEYKVKGLKPGKTYYFKVSTYKKVGKKTVYGVQSKEIVCKTIKKSAVLSQVHDFYYKGVLRESYTTGGVTFKAGQTVTVTYKGPSNYKITYKKKVYKIPKSKITLTGFVTNYKENYSKDIAEAFVNTKGYSSSKKYLIWINTYTQYMYIFKGSQYNWKLYKKFICATGLFGKDPETGRNTATPLGKSYIYGKQPTYWWGTDQVAYYCSRIAGGFIHSWLYKPNGSYYPGVGKMGTPSSHGCVRVDKENAKWIYNNCAVNTPVVVY